MAVFGPFVAVALFSFCLACHVLSAGCGTAGLIDQVVMEPQMAGLIELNDQDDGALDEGASAEMLIAAQRQYGEEEDEGDEYEEHQGRHKHGPDRERHQRGPDKEEEEEAVFVFQKGVRVMGTDAGEMHILPRGAKHELARKGIYLALLVMEPSSLFLPQYIDANFLFLVYTGRARISWVEKGKHQERDVEVGDIFKIEEGTVFHILNTDEGQRLKIFSIVDTKDVYNQGMFHNFFVAGGSNPNTVFSGFDEDVLATALKVTPEEVRDFESSQTNGPIVYYVSRNESTGSDAERSQKLSLIQRMNKYVGFPSFQFPSIFKDTEKKPFNIRKKKPDFSNDYGSTVAVDGNDYDMLKDVDKGVFLVRLKAGAVLAPHWNPQAMEIGLVTNGEGQIQIAFPNGSAAAKEHIRQGSVFFVPKSYPMCQIASRSGPLEFMGFSTSARPNRIQFLAGDNSVLKVMDYDAVAKAFNVAPEDAQHFFTSQNESVVLPGQVEPPRAEPEEKKVEPEKRLNGGRRGGEM